MSATSVTPVLEIRNVRKTFGKTVALEDVSFTLMPGQIHALAGENGAGKSTLMKIIDGIYQPDSGDIYLNGKKTRIADPLEAQRKGIGFVHQEIALCPDVSVAENILMAKTSASKKWFMDYKALKEQAKAAISQLADIDPNALLSELSISNQQLVEIAKALTLDCNILILDEPTAALTENESKILFEIMHQLKEKGISIIYISHRMAEIFEHCDQVTVFRDGNLVVSYPTSDTTPEQVVNDLVGRELTNLYPEKCTEDVEHNPTLLSVKNLSDNRYFRDIHFRVHQGEIFGISGLIGSGRSEMVKAICGLQAKQSGDVAYKGKTLDIRCYQDGIEAGIVYLSEDRKENGVFLELSIASNVSALNPDQVSRRGFIQHHLEDEQATRLTNELNLKSSGMSAPVSSLSGGNQQKVAIAKSLSVKPKVIIMDEPTRGIDVGAKSEIHKMIRRLATEGVAIIVISSELPEVIGLSDRIMVMCESRNAGVLTTSQISEENIMRLASGVTQQHVAAC
ncbi:Ribose import ATP-binding protein rbsA [Vibrio nigripulchritudo SO65]|uniref:sugar ABC transporter ATP-binding protein n=1 Tax=Vibrio nigripulchritudo TaxID=28173 RepID=UPI0003B23B5A|nr:sugar ABC transporter ATP-binding protein [Vibrio nigripulchritudo]CCN37303.1 Ribose import ATP-binding protein rbsA [Vibrio nigripulchritudo AM115]CCN38933.1 Ribose import ATP-binding protein rbsA [Vibrio nigripulchritudo FTn2]CCN66641.1 Ribose import ATP-binding protein rbsA [Vibrio nigripulchritudo POn4]CCN76147.1 Ribose import ATP-binding protein rbsA [Vibrio nigripulchritudo SO65]